MRGHRRIQQFVMSDGSLGGFIHLASCYVCAANSQCWGAPSRRVGFNYPGNYIGSDGDLDGSIPFTSISRIRWKHVWCDVLSRVITAFLRRANKYEEIEGTVGSFYVACSLKLFSNSVEHGHTDPRTRDPASRYSSPPTKSTQCAITQALARYAPQDKPIT